MNTSSETGCCPRFDPAPWEEKEVQWNDKLFVKDRVRSFFHIPLNFGAVMRRNQKFLQTPQQSTEPVLVLSDENSLWGADVYISVAQVTPGANIVRLSGTYFTKVYEGPFRNVRTWCADMQRHVKSKGRELKKLLFFYTTCPKCAKVYGKNYVVLFAQV